jgi:hypothetical protein
MITQNAVIAANLGATAAVSAIEAPVEELWALAEGAIVGFGRMLRIPFGGLGFPYVRQWPDIVAKVRNCPALIFLL